MSLIPKVSKNISTIYIKINITRKYNKRFLKLKYNNYIQN